ncbi:MAG TPA: universal stress protein [Candidatus Acidoferrum sp.]|nr:universal stress protein [Candidatus Acidoferrum sp.]
MPTVATQARIQLKNILFATDFSWAATTAAPYVNEIARHFGAHIVAAHIRPPAVNPMTYPTSWPVYVEAAETENKKHRSELLSLFPGETEVIIEEGDARTKLPALAEEKRIDLLVMGTHGRTGVPRFVLGSVAEEVFRKVGCPVLTVGPNSMPCLVNPGEFSRILFPTDFTAASFAAFPYALSLAQEFQAELMLLHVVPEPKPGDLVSAQDVRGGAEHRLHKMLPEEAMAWCRPDYVVVSGEIGEKILETAKRKRADLIVLGVHPETGFPGAATHLPIAVAHSVVAHAMCPVLTVRG